jgi:hypothetical protein
MEISPSLSPSGSYTNVNPPLSFFFALAIAESGPLEAAGPLALVSGLARVKDTVDAGGVTRLLAPESEMDDFPLNEWIAEGPADKLEAAGGASGTSLAWGMRSIVRG